LSPSPLLLSRESSTWRALAVAIEFAFARSRCGDFFKVAADRHSRDRRYVESGNSAVRTVPAPGGLSIRNRPPSGHAVVNSQQPVTGWVGSADTVVAYLDAQPTVTYRGGNLCASSL
jgi:hypothetical protein